MHYFICARNIVGNSFGSEPGELKYLKIKKNATEATPDDIIDSAVWIKEVAALASANTDARLGDAGDILIFVHGYNNTPGEVLDRHKLLETTLAAEKFKGVVCSFDWPSDNSILNYWEDRTDAYNTASNLISGGITQLAQAQKNGCATNIHLLAHSTGAYVVQQAFCRAKTIGTLFKHDWRIGQVAFIAADLGSNSLDKDDQESAEMFKRSMRITNYSNGFDHVLAVSNAKRLGVSPRAGRVGIPKDAAPNVVNVDCSDYFCGTNPDTYPQTGTYAHSWHFANPVFARDLVLTLTGGMDRNVIPTREFKANVGLTLVDKARPENWEKWA